MHPGLVVAIVAFLIFCLIMVFVAVEYGEKNKRKSYGPSTTPNTTSGQPIYPRKIRHELVGKWIRIEPSQYVRSLKLEHQNQSDVPRDSDGRMVLRYFEGKIIYYGQKNNFNETDAEGLRKVICYFFDLKDNEENKTLIDDKVKALMNAQLNPGNRRVHLDINDFLKTPKYYVFPFNNIGDKVCDDILFFCSSRAISLRKMPESRYLKGHNNYVAIFDRNAISKDDLKLLFYIYARKAVHGSFAYCKKIITLKSAFYESKDAISNDGSFDFCLEYFYKIIGDSSSVDQSFPDREVSTEIMARLLAYPGWPTTYEVATQLGMLHLEMYNSGVWKTYYHSEMDLFNLIRDKYPDALYQYRDQWLGGQSIDIYIPSRRLAVEYQGQQHYKSVSFYGGKGSLKKNQERDEKKRELCNKANVRLIEWKYDIDVSRENVDKYIV